ncbi:hypothetical protein BaRGS_00023793 [Batillaria attramentaria]|uniref:Ribosome biogenesis protein NOP53 n=1 Tax=Batillaria attramentaria TaxID=370345 RepID=A0ABD0KDI0_9CAEN
MADHVLSTNSEPKFSRKRKLGKNKKKSWRAVDITETEEFLEDQRFQLRTTGLVAEKADDQLFLVDKTKEEANTVPKKLSALTLATEEKKANSFTRCQAVKQRKQALQEKAAQLKKKNCLPQFEHDLWDGDGDDGADDYYLEVTKKRRVKPPVKPTSTTKPAVEPPHPGASYNPAYDDHQDLLLQAHAVEMKKEKEEQRIYNALDAKFPSLAERPSEATWLEEMSGGLFAYEEQDGETQTGDDDRVSVNPPVSRAQRKTKKEKRKAQEAKAERQKLLKKKEKKLRENMVFRIPTLHLELKLSNELVGSLRHLKPEGHLLEDRYKSLQKRNIIEPRKKVRRTKVKKKTFQRKSHRNVV